MTVVRQEYTTDKATDFNAILSSIRAAQPDVVFYGGYSSQAGPMLRQMVTQGIRAPLLGGDGICTTETSRLSGGSLADGRVFCSQAGGVLDQADAGRAFAAKYRAAYQRDPLTYAVSFYDAAMLLADAMQKTGSTDPGKLAEQLAAGRYVGVAGEYAFNAAHDLKQSPVSVYGFKGGQPQVLGR